MNRFFHSVTNWLAAKFMKLLFGYSSRICVAGCDNAERSGGFLLASNHISHFDPFIISGQQGRYLFVGSVIVLPLVLLFAGGTIYFQRRAL